MLLRLRGELLGGHWHVRVWAGPDDEHLALCGNLVFAPGEWELLRGALLSRPGCAYDPFHETVTVSGGAPVGADRRGEES